MRALVVQLKFTGPNLTLTLPCSGSTPQNLVIILKQTFTTIWNPA